MVPSWREIRLELQLVELQQQRLDNSIRECLSKRIPELNRKLAILKECNKEKERIISPNSSISEILKESTPLASPSPITSSSPVSYVSEYQPFFHNIMPSNGPFCSLDKPLNQLFKENNPRAYSKLNERSNYIKTKINRREKLRKAMLERAKLGKCLRSFKQMSTQDRKPIRKLFSDYEIANTRSRIPRSFSMTSSKQNGFKQDGMFSTVVNHMSRESRSKPIELGPIDVKFRFTEKEMRKQTARIYNKLPEVQAKKEQEETKHIYSYNYKMGQEYSKKLKDNLKYHGQINYPITC